MDLINIKARVPDSIASPILVAEKQSVIIGFHVVNITASSSVIDIILRRGVSDTYIIKEHTISGSDPYNPLTGRFILQLGDEVYIKSLGTDTADCFISYCEIDDIGGGSSYDPRVPVIQSGEGNYIFRAKLDETGYELVPTTEVFPTFTAPADNDKYLSIVEGVISWVPKPNSLPDITAPADNGKFLSVVDGASTWVTAPNSLPDITTVDEGKALAVIDGASKWCDPLAELGMGTGFFELDDELNIVPKARSQLYSEINLGSGHFEFTGEGDLRMKSGGDYRVGSTLPPHNAGDNGKVLQVSAGEPAWGVGVPIPAAGDEGKSLLVDGSLAYILDTVSGGSDLLGTAVYARSEPFTRDSANTLATPLAKVEVDGALLSFSAGTIGLNTEASWDASTYATPANRSGKDFYVYATADGLILSANATFPTGYTTENSRKIGGFHCLCVAVGTISGHPLSGFAAGDILPASVWDLQHRPLCSPEGMVWSEAAGIWVDIYLQSGTGASTKSANGGTITDMRDWMDFVDDLGAVGKRLLDDGEFQRIAEGCNQETNIAGSADPGTTTGHVDTAGRRMISNIGCEDCAGVVSQWLLDQSYRFESTFAAVWGWYNLPGDKGELYNYDSTGGRSDVKLVAGGYWTNGASCGSRCRHASGYRWYVGSSIGARGCCGAMFG